MKSPITGKEMILTQERRSMEFRKEKFEIVFHYYKCTDSGEQFTTTALDEVNLNQVYNQYRDKLNIPFPDEIIEIREKYGLSAAKMSEILGFGVNSYRQYEAGEIPSTANAKLIQMAKDPQTFIDMIELCSTIDEKLKTKYIQKTQLLVEEGKQNDINQNLKTYFLGNPLADIYSGYRNPNLEKFTEMVVYFSEKMQPFKTKLNKLLFYADFLMFNQSCFSISGKRYVAIDKGPVPDKYASIYEYLINEKQVEVQYSEFVLGYKGTQFIARKDRPFNAVLFSEAELKVLDKVATLFQSTSTQDIIELSHLEEAWIQNQKDKSVISYEYAFELKQI